MGQVMNFAGQDPNLQATFRHSFLVGCASCSPQITIDYLKTQEIAFAPFLEPLESGLLRQDPKECVATLAFGGLIDYGDEKQCRVLQTAVSDWFDQAPDEAAEWITKQPASRARDIGCMGAAQFYIGLGQLEAAKAWREKVGDGAIKSP